MIRADEDTLTNLISNWSDISSSKGWSIDYLHKFQEQDENAIPSAEAPPVDDEFNSVTTPATSPLHTPVVQTNSPTLTPSLQEN